MLRAGAFEIAISVPLALEYEALLIRHGRTLGLHPSEAVKVVDYLCAVARRQRIHFLWRPTLRDPNDDFVLEVAVAAGCDRIVTHKIADFEGAERFGLTVVRPGGLLRHLEEAL